MQAKGTFEVKQWDEAPYKELGEGAKLTRASVSQVFGGDIEGNGTSEALMYYSGSGSATFTGLLHVSGRLGGRSGSFVLHGSGTYESGTAKENWTVIPGSGTEQLRGLRGTGGYSAEHGMSVDYRLDYEIVEGEGA